MANVKHPTVWITGASRGIGAAIAWRFAQEGYQVAINYYQSQEKAQQLAAKLNQAGGRTAIFRGDVAQVKQVEAMAEAVRQTFGQIDVLVNNAGIAQQRLFTEITGAQWERMFDVNVKGMFHCCQAVLPAMIQRRQGKIINISSMWGLTGASCEVHYSAAKAAVVGLTKALAKEVGLSKIQVNCVAPGLIDTEMNRALAPEDLAAVAAETALGRLGQPDEVANAVWFLASHQADYITGQVLSVDGGMVI